MKKIFLIWTKEMEIILKDVRMDTNNYLYDNELQIFAIVCKGENSAIFQKDPKLFEVIYSKQASPNSQLFQIIITIQTQLHSSSYYSRDNIVIVDPVDQWQEFLIEWNKNSRSPIKCEWKSTLSAALVENVCQKCNLILPTTESKRHFTDTCNNCHQPYCNGKNHQLITSPICAQANCSEALIACSPDIIDAHEKSHPHCTHCNKYFRDAWYFNNHNNTQCRHCRSRKCPENKEHEGLRWPMCRKIGCDYSFGRCMHDKNAENHLKTHPKCPDCKEYLICKSTLQSPHQYSFSCKDCKYIFKTSVEWLEHSRKENHILKCNCIKCRNSPPAYFAKHKKMEQHLEDNGVQCDCGKYFLDKEGLECHKRKCSTYKPPPTPPIASVPPTVPPSLSSTTGITWGSAEEGLAKLLHEYHGVLNCPIWTLLSSERDHLKLIRSEVLNKLSSISSEVREQGSMVKNTAIPGYVDFDFIMYIKDRQVSLRMMKDNISQKLPTLEGFRLLFGDDQIQTWIYKDITFDLVISLPDDELGKDLTANLAAMVAEPGNQRDQLHSYTRALKYWCKRSQVSIKSFVVEHIAKVLFLDQQKGTFRDFLEFISKDGWSRQLPKLSTPPLSEKELLSVKELATRSIEFLSKLEK